jgi:hypothetical protein
MRDHAKARAAMTDILQNSASQNLKFEREDWSLFRTFEGSRERHSFRHRGSAMA